MRSFSTQRVHPSKFSRISQRSNKCFATAQQIKRAKYHALRCARAQDAELISENLDRCELRRTGATPLDKPCGSYVLRMLFPAIVMIGSYRPGPHLLLLSHRKKHNAVVRVRLTRPESLSLHLFSMLSHRRDQATPSSMDFLLSLIHISEPTR